MAGGCAGMAVDFVLFPLDTIKTRMQVRPGAHVNVTTGSAIASALRSGAFYRGEFVLKVETGYGIAGCRWPKSQSCGKC